MGLEAEPRTKNGFKGFRSSLEAEPRTKNGFHGFRSSLEAEPRTKNGFKGFRSSLEAEPRTKNGFHGFRSSISSDNFNSQSEPVPSPCDSCKAEVTKILAADCDKLDNEAAKDLCEKLESEEPVVVSIKSPLEPEPLCTAVGACQIERFCRCPRCPWKC